MMKRERAAHAGRQAGFTMAEVLVAVALAGVVLAGAVYMFGQSVDVSTIVTLRGEMQQNARVAINLIYRDISVAGTGIPSGGIQLPYASGGGVTPPRLGCDMTLACYVKVGGAPAGAVLNYYQSLDGGTTHNSWLYAINPQDGQGPSIATPNTGGSVDRDPWSSTAGVTLVPTDVITIAYQDNSYPVTWNGSAGGPLNQYPVTSISISGSPATVKFNAATNPGLADPAYGLNNGDILLFSNANGTAVALVTAVVPATNTVDMASTGDPLLLNQMSAPIGSLASIQNFVGGVPQGTFPQTTAYRIIVVTYYLDNNTNPGYPRLMRQVNALPPTPVAQNIENLQFSYDVFDTTSGTVCPNIANPFNPSTACSTGAYYSPNQIGKVNIFVQARASSQRLVNRGYSRVSMISSVTPRNLDFVDRY